MMKSALVILAISAVGQTNEPTFQIHRDLPIIHVEKNVLVADYMIGSNRQKTMLCQRYYKNNINPEPGVVEYDHFIITSLEGIGLPMLQVSTCRLTLPPNTKLIRVYGNDGNHYKEIAVP